MKRTEVGDFLATLAVMERGGSSVRAAAFPLPPTTRTTRPRAPTTRTATGEATEDREARPTQAASRRSSCRSTARRTSCRSATWPSRRCGGRRTGWSCTPKGTPICRRGASSRTFGRGLEEREALAHRGRAARVPGGPRDAGHPAAADRDRRGRGHRRRAARRDVARARSAPSRRRAPAPAERRGGRGTGRARDGADKQRPTPRAARAPRMAPRREARSRRRGARPAPAHDGVAGARRRQAGRLAAAQPSLARGRRRRRGLDSLRPAAARHDPRPERDDGHAPVAQASRAKRCFSSRPTAASPTRSSHPFRVARFTNGDGRRARARPDRGLRGRRLPRPGDGRSAAGGRARPPCRSRSSAASPSTQDRKFDELGARLAKIENGELTIERDSRDADQVPHPQRRRPARPSCS